MASYLQRSRVLSMLSVVVLLLLAFGAHESLAARSSGTSKRVGEGIRGRGLADAGGYGFGYTYDTDGAGGVGGAGGGYGAPGAPGAPGYYVFGPYGGWNTGGWNRAGGWDYFGNWNSAGGWNNRPPWFAGDGGKRR